MQTQLFTTECATALIDRLWAKAAVKECYLYGEHGQHIEHAAGGNICADCRQVV